MVREKDLAQSAEEISDASELAPNSEQRNIHRIGGASIENLRLKPTEVNLNPPGISVIKAASPSEAAAEIRAGYRSAKRLHELAKTIGSATVEAIEKAGFQVVPTPSKNLPNHHRIIHADGVAGFSDDNLARLAGAFVNTTGY